MSYLVALAALQLMSPGAEEARFAPPQSRESLHAQILAVDTILFDNVFNRCELDRVDEITTPDVTMIHDQGGMDIGREAFFIPVRENICSGGPVKPLRVLDPHTMEVFPLYESGVLYGAIQRGRHSFYQREGGGEPQLTNRARFFHLWKLSETGWRLQTAISFDHMNPSENHPMDMDVLFAGFDRDDDIEFMMQETGVTGLSVAVIEAGSVSQLRSFGARSPNDRMSTDTIFNVASLAKPVTALLALKLSAEGRWDLDRPLADFHVDPDLVGSAEAGLVTTRHVLTHTTGLPNWRYLEDPQRLAFDFSPGTRYQYSGEGFEWLRHALEAATGESLEALAQRLIFDPVGMADTSYLFPDATADRIATRYDDDGGPVAAAPHRTANGAANLMTTAGDYGRFVAYLLDGAELPEPLAKAMFENQLPASFGTSFGLGWSLTPGLPDGETAFVHTGSDAGVRAIAIGLPDSRRGLVILSNSEQAMPAWSGIISEVWGETGAALVALARE